MPLGLSRIQTRPRPHEAMPSRHVSESLNSRLCAAPATSHVAVIQTVFS